MTPLQKSLDRIEVTGLRVDCIVGLYPNERVVPQPLIVSLSLDIDTRAATTKGIECTIDYACLAGEVRFLMESSQFHLLETAGEAICAYILAPAPPGVARPHIARACVQLEKPGVISGASPKVTVHRAAGEFDYKSVDSAFGNTCEIYLRPRSSITRVSLLPSQAMPRHQDVGEEALDVFELALSEGLALGERAIAVGSGGQFSESQGLGFKNTRGEISSVLRVVRPQGARTTLPEAPSLRRFYPEGMYL